MQSCAPAGGVSKTALWAGGIIGVLPVLLLLMAAGMILTKQPAVAEGMAKYGYPPGFIPVLGVIALVCAVIYLFPPTAVLGAILITGYMGGAVSTHVRAGEPCWLPVI